MILRIALLLVSIPLLAHGGERLFLAARSRTQAQVSCEEFFRHQPRSRWVRITGCELDYVRAGYRESGGRITELLFPLRPTGTSPALPAALVVATRDPRVLAIAEGKIHSAANGNQEGFLVMMLQVVTAMRASREVDGVTRGQMEMLRTRNALSAIRAPLADDFTILDLHARPNLLWPAVEVAAGAVALLSFVFLLATRRRRQVKKDEEAVEEPAAAEPEYQVPALRGLMLLNLPAAATAADVEGAPPLGSASDVQERIAKVLPGIQFNEAGRATYNRPDFSLTIDLGAADPVYTAVVDLQGDGAARVFGRLVTQIGWRAFAPKKGAFVSISDPATPPA